MIVARPRSIAHEKNRRGLIIRRDDGCGCRNDDVKERPVNVCKIKWNFRSWTSVSRLCDSPSASLALIAKGDGLTVGTRSISHGRMNITWKDCIMEVVGGTVDLHHFRSLIMDACLKRAMFLNKMPSISTESKKNVWSHTREPLPRVWKNIEIKH